MPKKNMVAGIMAAAMLATAVAGPVSAFAATTKTTPVNVKADDSNLTVTVPTEIAFTVSPDGTMTAANTQITNGSNFAIHVSDVAVAEQSPFKLVADADKATEDNAIAFSFGVAGAQIAAHNASKTMLTQGSYDMGPTGASNQTLEITASGKAKNIKQNIAQKQQIANITWTFSAGQAQ